MANGLPKACQDFLTLTASLKTTWETLQRNLTLQVDLLAPPLPPSLEGLVAQEETLVKGIFSLSNLIETKARDLESAGYLKSARLAAWRDEQHRQKNQYLAQKEIIVRGLKKLESKQKMDLKAHRNATSTRRTRSAYAHPSRFDISL